MKKFYSSLYRLLTIVSIMACCKTEVFSQSGLLDVTFGNGGKVVTATGDSNSAANAIAIQPDGKIVTGGYCFVAGRPVFTLVRYNVDGTLDNTFGIAGKSITTTFGDESKISDIAIQANGKIVAGGYFRLDSTYNDGFLIAMYNTNGSLDSSFGIDGAVHTSFQYGFSRIKKLLIKPDGKILAGGFVHEWTFEQYPALCQYMPNGDLDTTFGVGGMLVKGIFASPGKAIGVNDMALTADGKIVAAIDVDFIWANLSDFIMCRLLANGDNDSTFGTGGIVRTDLNQTSGDNAYGVVILPDSSIVLTGLTHFSPLSRIALVKYHANGSIDNTFGANGKVYTTINTNSPLSSRILVTADGSLLVCGNTFNPDENFLLIKYLSNGTPDNAFGTNGIVTTDFFGYNDESICSALQADGKLIVAGQASDNTKYSIALARYRNGVLPIRLVTFKAIRNGRNNVLQWTTSLEINVDNFEIERSNNGREYNSIGKIKGGLNVYQFTDNKPFQGVNYYMLKMIDKDGKFEFSPIKIINNKGNFYAGIYPNPARDKLQVHLISDKKKNFKIDVVGMDGKVFFSNRWTVEEGSSLRILNVSFLEQGSYVLRFESEDKQQEVVRFTKM